MLNNKIRVITYIRVGSREQDAIYKKTEIMKALLDEHKDEWEIIDEAFDYGFSGRKDYRPALNYVLEMCKEKKVDMVVTLSPAMLARDVLLYKDIYTTIRNSKVELYIKDLKCNTSKQVENYNSNLRIPKLAI